KETNIFEKSEEKTDSLNIQVKSKGDSKFRNSGKICAAKIETSGSTGNIISHLGRKHKIYEYSIPLKATSSLKQIKIDHYTILSDSLSQMTQDQHKYLETLLFEWLILDFQLLYLLKSPSFRKFIYALNKNFELSTDKEF
ncbi:10394_t:CDS:2, partial [Funneliformis geosporum]